jgi:hypothetical protein
MVEYQHGVGWAHMFPRRLESPGTEYSVVDVARGLPGTSLSTWSDGSERRNLDIDSFGRVDELPRTDLRAETVLLHDEDSLLGKWELFIDLPAANYRVFPDGNLLIYSNARREDPMRLDDTVILDPRGEIVSKGTFGRDAFDVQITAGGDMWVAFGELEVGDDRIFNGIAKFSPTFEVLWAPENELIETYDVAVLGGIRTDLGQHLGRGSRSAGRRQCQAGTVCCRRSESCTVRRAGNGDSSNSASTGTSS